MCSKQASGYKVRNWREYNASLVNRGDLTIWLSDEALEQWEHPNDTVKVGRPFVYSDSAIECLLTIRELFRLPYRQTEGFGRWLMTLLGSGVQIPDYSSLAKRAGKLQITSHLSQHSGKLVVVIDSTGLKVFGEGEWKVRTHGASKRRTWRKLHLAIDPNTGEILAELLTENSCHDADAVPELLEQIPQPIEQLVGDGIYDQWKVYNRLAKQAIEPVIPPQRNAKIKQHGNLQTAPLPRDQAIRRIRQVGRRQWKVEVGYHQRSLAETTMYRMKQTFGDELKNRLLPNQQTETRIRCKILNKFNHRQLSQVCRN